MSAAGIPLAERPKGKVPKGKDASTPDMTSSLRGYGMGTLRGKPAYTNGYFALQGEPAEKFRGVDMSGRLDQLVMDGRRQVAAIGYAEVAAGIPAIVFDDGGVVNAGIYDHIMRAFPRAVFCRDRESKDGPYTVESGGETVGCAMPIRCPFVPVNLRALVDPGALRSLDQASASPSRRGREAREERD